VVRFSERSIVCCNDIILSTILFYYIHNTLYTAHIEQKTMNNNINNSLINNGIGEMYNGIDDNHDYFDHSESRFLPDLNKSNWKQIRRNDPATKYIYIRFDDEDSFVFDIDWESEGRYFSSNTSLKHVVLYELRSHSISDRLCHLFRGLAQNRSIEKLDIHDSDIKDNSWLPLLWPLFENNNNLHSFEVQDCSIECAHTDFFNVLARTMERCSKTSLREFIMVQNDIDSPESMIDIIQSLNMHQNIEVLGMQSGNNQGGEGVWKALGNLLKCSSKLRKINLNNTRIKDKQISDIADGLIRNKSLSHISMMENTEITAAGWQTFLKKAISIPQLTKLDTSYNNIDDEGIVILGEWIKRSKPKILDISANEEVSTTGWWRFAMDLPSCCVNINLSDNKIDDVGLIQLGRVIKESATLKVLDLSSNETATSHGWSRILSDVCIHNSALERLSLYSTDIDNDCLVTLASWMTNNSRLKYLDVASNEQVSLDGWLAFFGVLHNSNSGLETLDISNNQLSFTPFIDVQEGLGIIVKTLQLLSTMVNSLGSLRSMKTLDLSSSLVSIPSWNWADSLANILHNQSCDLESLSLSHNDIEDAGVISFSAALANNNSLRELKLNGSISVISDLGWGALTKALCDMSSIEATYTSNHTLHCVSGEDDDDDNDIPFALEELLYINKYNTESEAARQKIIKYHMLKDDGIDVGVFIGMELNKLPSAISWMVRERDDIGLSVLYQLCKSLPFLFESNLKVAGLKRKRE